jgi:hypothetical protein
MTRLLHDAHQPEALRTAAAVPATCSPGRLTPNEAEGVGFEPTVDQTADNGFRDRVEAAAIPHHNWNQYPGGMQGE